MNEEHCKQIASELNLPSASVRAASGLLSEGCTIPFIARYRKELTDSMDEVALTAVRDRLEQLAELDKRRDAILKSLRERDLLTPQLETALTNSQSMTELEDIYLPFRPKRRTRATIARERGLEPLAEMLFSLQSGAPEDWAKDFVSPEQGVETTEAALAGSRDIIAEWINEDQNVRASMRRLFSEKGAIRTHVIKGKEVAGAKFSDYFDWREDAANAPGHRILAVFRGEKEEVLALTIRPPEDLALDSLVRRFASAGTPAAHQVAEAARDCYKRLLTPSMETETRNDIKRRADTEAIKVFAENVRELLLASPLGEKRVMALDPGFRTGAKLVCLDGQGQLLHHETVYPTHSGQQARRAGETIQALCERFSIEAIAIGNGTASRETEAFVRSLELPPSIILVMVNESGASVYSASKVAREEFPNHDVTVRGAVSIGRRLKDPLAELVKIDPKAIGVGQYQHDVDQPALKRALDDVVTSCVNAVGVEVNTASKELLTYVSGLGPTLSQKLVEYRDAYGPFSSRAELKKVPRLGPKAFEQSAGFLRIRGSSHPLDASAVHPESYEVVEQMARDLACSVQDLVADEARRDLIDLHRYVSGTMGLPTLNDILNELAKPGRDPRKEFEAFAFADGVNSIEDLAVGMKLPGIVTNVTRFGAFVDIGVHQDGLVHISQLADRFVRDPSEVVKVQQHVEVTVLEVDMARNRIALSMKNNPATGPSPKRAKQASDPPSTGFGSKLAEALNRR